MMRLRSIFTLSLCLGLVLFALPAGAQSAATTGAIEGTVTDDSGGVLPGVSVALRNTATNYETTVTTGPNGRFRGLLLPLGPYRISASLSGFAKVVREGINVSVGQSVNVAITMSLAAKVEEILVTAENPVVETTRPEGSTRIDALALKEIPNNGRNFLEFTKLTPGVSIVQGPDGDELTVNGQKGIQNNVSVDGADFNNPFFGEQRGGQRPAFTFNLDAVQEVVVVADGANAEYGRSSSGFVNVVTKSGTNAFAGTVNLFYKDDALASAAKNPDGTSSEKFDSSQVQGGFTLGGPVVKDKVFFFVAVDAQGGDSTKQTDPNRIEQRVVDYFASVGSPDENGAIDRSNDAFVALGKVDWFVSPQHVATLRGTYTNSTQENGTFDVDSWGRSANAIEDNWSKSLTGTLISNFTTVMNEFRFQLAREDRPRPYNGPNIDGQDRPLPDTAFDFGKSYRFGMPFFIPVDYYDTRLQLNDNVTLLKGTHEIKAGVEYNRVNATQVFRGFANGRFIFSSTDGFLNYARNRSYVECSDGSTNANGICPPGTTVTGPVLLFLQQAGVGGLTAEEAGTQSIVQDEPAVFIQDKWQPLPNLTIQAGLRWEAQIQPDPITPADEVFYAGFIGESSQGQEFPSDGTMPSDKSMWQPRLGITWDPTKDGKTVVRANAGIYNARVPGLSFASTRSTNGSRGQSIYRDSSLTGILGAVPAYPNLVPTSAVGTPFRPDIYVTAKDFQNPRTFATSIGVEREFLKDYGFLLKYNYAKTTHLTRFINRNDALLGSPWTSGLNGGPNGVSTLTTVESSAKSEYNGITFGINKRWSHNYQFQINYTLSWDRSDDDNERDPFTFRYAKVTDLGAEWGYSDRDQRHRLNSLFVWKGPGDVNFNFRYAYRSAQPKSITATGADANTPQDRINADGSVTQRNLGRKDNEFSSLDIRLSRPFDLGGFQIEPIVECFNVFNSKNLKKPEVTSLIFNFDGTVQSGLGDARQVQLGLRVIF
ncbi:MAG: carboxypeptidase regulatory-like domain-containing protein [Holophagales bacterium]|nr:carboxypeptidase regulatory-like domain-containing protein [Holophagales bacterium]